MPYIPMSKANPLSELERVYQKLETGPNTAKERGILRRRRARLKRDMEGLWKRAPSVYDAIYGGFIYSFDPMRFFGERESR